MALLDPKAVLHHYLQEAREALVWKLTDLSEYDARRPLTPTGTNLLGLVKHVAACEIEYFGACFGRPFPDPPAWMSSDEPNVDMWARAEETRDDVVGLYRRAWTHSDATIAALALENTGHVAWWRPESQRSTLQRLLVHMIAETHRHAGHADIVRELVDGAVGLKRGNENLHEGGTQWWSAYRAQVLQAAKDAGGRG